MCTYGNENCNKKRFSTEISRNLVYWGSRKNERTHKRFQKKINERVKKIADRLK